MSWKLRAGLLALFAGAAVLLGIGWTRSASHREQLLPPRVAARPARLLADGHDEATLTIEASSPYPPNVTVDDSRRGAIEQMTGAGGRWEGRIRAGIMPGTMCVRVEFRNGTAATVKLTSVLDARDSFEDGTPDFLRLDDEHDRQAFRHWFTYLAEAQYFQTKPRPAEIDDCAALIRYAYREALHAHDSGWAESAGLALVPAFDSVVKYRYPSTPLGAALFRVHAGGFRPADLANGAFAQFADAKTLLRLNTHFVSRDAGRALAGDLLFFRQSGAETTFHSMIYLGASQFERGGGPYAVYHTGPDGRNPGEIRRPALAELMRFPQPEWRPEPNNPGFLGVFRWNILRKGSDDDDARD
ncbi:MAG: DUF1175 family protein [Bryobacteraceae bacterium]